METYTLREAAEWLAFRGADLTAEELIERQDELNLAKHTLQRALSTGKIEITGKQGFMREGFLVENDSDLNYKNNMIRLKDSYGYTGTEYTDIEISVADLHKNFSKPPAEPRGSAPQNSKGSPTYTTPYLEIMHEVIEELGITKENRLLKKELVAPIVAKMKNRVPESKEAAEYMAMFIRPPEAQKGGVKKGRPPAKKTSR